ncbi:MAG: LysE family translocator [Peptococcaceae bacterium]
MEIWLKGFIIGLSIAAPVGPVGVLAIRRTLAAGRLCGFVTGMGAAVTDFIYAFIGGFGLTIISNFLIVNQSLIRLVGGFFIIYLGCKIFISDPAEKAAAVMGKGLGGTFLSSFIIAITNPIAIIYYIAVFAGLGGSDMISYSAASLLVAGVFTGSALWWLILSQGVGLLKNKVTVRGIRLVNRISGMIIAGFGIYAIYSGIF